VLRNGWITYEDNIRGDCLKVWSGQLPKEAKAKPKTVQDKICDWAKKIAADDSWHYVTFSMKDRKTHECAICKKHPKGKYHGWNCIGFAFASWRHGGGIPCNCSCGVFGNEEAEKMLRARKALPIAQKLIGVKELRILRNDVTLRAVLDRNLQIQVGFDRFGLLITSNHNAADHQHSKYQCQYSVKFHCNISFAFFSHVYYTV
jgi:hypothetical protein